MAEEEVKCDKCGTLNQRDNIYCTSCGNLLRISSGEPITFRDSTPSTEKKKIKLISFFIFIDLSYINVSRNIYKQNSNS